MRKMALLRSALMVCAGGIWLGSAVWAAPVKMVFHHEGKRASGQRDVPFVVKPPITPPTRTEGCTPPANDDCANATPILTLPYTDTVDTSCATDEAGEPPSECTVGAGSVWYTYVNTGASPALVSADTFQSDFDTTMQLLTGTCGSQTVLACNDDAGGNTGFQSQISWIATPGVVYYLQINGFDGDFGTMVLNVDVIGGSCAPTTLDGTLGSAASTGLQTGRLNRNGIPSSCATPKVCDIFDPTGSRQFDSYTIPNDSGAAQCVAVHLEVPDGQAATCNLQSNVYLNSYDPANICTNYLADPGLSSGGAPEAPTDMSFVLPAATSGVVVVHTINPGEDVGCTYTVTVFGDICGAPAEADLSLSKTLATGGTIHVGDNVVFNLTVSNAGPGNATGVVVTDTLPAGLTYVSNDCGATFSTPTLTWNVGALASSGSATCHLTVTVNQSGPNVNVASASANETDPVPANNAATATVVGQFSIVEVPTLGQSGLIALLVLLGSLGLVTLRRRRPSGN